MKHAEKASVGLKARVLKLRTCNWRKCNCRRHQENHLVRFTMATWNLDLTNCFISQISVLIYVAFVDPKGLKS